jgi:regulator of replication initiation timing
MQVSNFEDAKRFLDTQVCEQNDQIEKLMSESDMFQSQSTLQLDEIKDLQKSRNLLEALKIDFESQKGVADQKTIIERDLREKINWKDSDCKSHLKKLEELEKLVDRKNAQILEQSQSLQTAVKQNSEMKSELDTLRKNFESVKGKLIETQKQESYLRIEVNQREFDKKKLKDSLCNIFFFGFNC